jgi:predicted nucleotidyltransferase
MKRQQIITILKEQKDLLRRYSIDKIYLFGSSARDEATETSDVDLIVEFDPNARIGLIRFSQLRHELSRVLNYNVDLTTPDALHHALKADILKEAGYPCRLDAGISAQTDLPAIVPVLKKLLP